MSFISRYRTLMANLIRKIEIIIVGHKLSIHGPSNTVGVTCDFKAVYDNAEVLSGETWSIVSGQEYATIDGSGTLTILSGANESEVIISCTYNDLTETKEIVATYDAGTSNSSETSSSTEVNQDGSTTQTTTTTTTTTDQQGNTTTTTTITETTINQDGSSSTVESEVVNNTDGSSTESSTTTNYDDSGNVTGSSSNQTTNNIDGSSSSTTTNYDASGDPTDTTNTETDTQGNVNTQDIEYNEDGDAVVTGYSIDTTNNEDGSKNLNGDGINTEYYAFDVTRGFILDFHFTIDFSNQPPDQDENHHNILTMKRATPSPWYGFQLRHSSTNRVIVLGTQFSSGSNTNTQLAPTTLTGTVAEYDLRITYDPTASSNRFVCKNMTTNADVYTNNGVFPDIPELRYLKVTLGYAMDANGDPYRFSNINVINFSITKLPAPIVLARPVISCDGEYVTITCETQGSSIYYRLDQTGTYSLYTSPIEISRTTVVEAYSVLNNNTSITVSETCVYEGVLDPVISCNGDQVTITCETSGADIYYRLDQSGSFSQYSGPISIVSDTIVEAYATLGNRTSQTVTETCVYNPEHDYSQDYLTFEITSDGVISWSALGSGSEKTIQYSINNDGWVSITSNSTPETISVSAGDSVRFKGTNNTYAGSNVNYSGFDGTTAGFNVLGNIMSLVYGDNFIGNNTLSGSYNFCSLFKLANVISAENLILPATTLTPQCYRALFANSTSLEVAPKLPATTLAQNCYRYMFQDCGITTAPDLLASTLVLGCYDGMFSGCTHLNYIKCLAKNVESVAATTSWTQSVATSGTFVKDANTTWLTGVSGIPSRWVVSEVGVKNPTVSCDGLYITLECATQGADIYYRLGGSGEYLLYSLPISISADTIIETYSELSGETSNVVSETCLYDDGIEEPIIYCDGEYITISCDTGGATIYYRLDQEGAYIQYDSAIAILEDTVVEAYSEIDGRQSEVVLLNCIYDASLKAPVITCDGTEIIITCTTAGADIYYRLNQEGNYSLYSSPISITEDTFIEAYSELDNETSSVVSETCIYDNTHDYSQDYLTFNILSDGTVSWKSVGSGQAKTIQYSLNNSAWTSITASSSTTISVSTGDTVRFKGSNNTYAKDKSNYSGFEGGSASFNVEGNIMSLVYGDNFAGNSTLSGTYNFCSIFKLAKCVSAENLVLPAITLTKYCYRAMFSKCTDLVVAPALPATTLAQGCYWYMFEECPITTAPELLAETLVAECYGWMFIKCASLSYIKCMARAGFSTTNCKQGWVQTVAASGTFVKNSAVTVSTWGSGQNGIPSGWLVYDDVAIEAPVIACDGEYVTITCDTQGATVYYRMGGSGNYSVYSSPIVISANTLFEAYSEFNNQESRVVSQTCEYISNIPFEASNRNLYTWNYNNREITTPYSINALDGHSSSYAKGTFNFETSFALRQAQPAYLWFQHADQSATIYVDNVMVEKHWGGYNAFFIDISNYTHAGTNNVKVAIKNNEGNYLAPAAGDFNFNATLGNVKLYTSPYLPATNYGYDGFHVTSSVSSSSATINVRTSVPIGAVVKCIIDDGTYHYEDSANSTGEEMTFTTTITNPHLWNGLADPHLYNITLEISHDGDLYHRYVRPYGLRFYEYVFNDTSILGNGDPYTGFLLNGSPYLLRGVCMHNDIEGKANAESDADVANDFALIQELGCNFIRLAHYPHPKEIYDWCDRIGIVVQTEVPCVNKMQSTMPADYYDHLNGQYDDMVNQHFNHPCILFWGLSNETTTDDKVFANTKINGYIARIKNLDSERMVGYVMAQSASDPSGYYNDPNADWFGCNIYEGWYSNTSSNNPTAAINTRIRNLITNKSKAMAYSEYGCGGTQNCHSDDFMTTTTRGNNPRHDIEYMMWLHEGHIAAIKNFPQLLFTSQWQLFDIAVANRNEGYTVCLDGENTTTDDELRRLNNKGLVERDHTTKKDTFYLYKAWWNTADKFVHICGKDYTKMLDRVIKCYSNDGSSFSLYVNNTFIETVTATDNIVLFAARNFSAGDIVRVEGAETSDTFTF